MKSNVTQTYIRATDKTSAAYRSAKMNVKMLGNEGVKLNRILAFAGGAVGVSSITALIRKTVEYGSAITDSAKATNTGVEELQALYFLADKAGASTENLNNILIRSQKSAYDAANGLSTAKRAFAALGIDVQKFIKLPTERKIEMIGQRMRDSTDKNKAYGAALDILGTRNAPRLMEVLEDLAVKGFDEVSRAAQKAGQVMSTESAQSMDALADSLERMQKRVTVTTSTLLATGLAFSPWGDAAAQVAVLDGAIKKLMDNLESGGNQLYIDQTTEKLKALLAVRQEIGKAAGMPLITALPDMGDTADSMEKASEYTDKVTLSMDKAAKASERLKLAKMSLGERLEYTQGNVAKLEAEYLALEGVIVNSSSRTEDDLVAWYGKQSELSAARVEQLRLEQQAERENQAARAESLNLLNQMSGEGSVSLDDVFAAMDPETESKKAAYNDLSLEVLNTNQLMMHSMENASDAMTNSFMSFIETGKLNFKDLTASVLSDIARMIIQMQVINPMLNGLMGGGAGGGLGGLLGSLFHEGGVVGSGGSSRSVSPVVFSGAPRYHKGGVAGLKPGEVPSILMAGEEVLTKRDPRHRNNLDSGDGALQQPSAPVTINFTIKAVDSASVSQVISKHRREIVGVVDEAMNRRGRRGASQ